MRTRYSTSLLVCLAPFALAAQQNEIEPNESVQTANGWTWGQTMSGSECAPPSFDADYFLFVIPSDGVLNFSIVSQGSGPNPGNLQFALFPKYGFYQQYHTLPGTTSPTTTTFSHGCLSGDTMYVRIQEENMGANSCVSYEMSCTVTPAVFANDLLPNDDFANPQPVPLGTQITGHLDFLYDASADHYGVTLPEDGTLRIIAEAEHADTSTQSTVQIYCNVNNSYYYPVIGASGVVPSADTFYLPCFAAQLATIRVQEGTGNPCGISYRLRFDLIPHPFDNDLLPNDDFNNPQQIALNTPIEGHLDHFGETTPDHYGITLPDDGTLLIIGEAEQFDADTLGTVEVYVAMNNSYHYIPVGGNSTAGVDTFRVSCLRAGPVTVRLQASTPDGCGVSYRVRFELVPPDFSNDPEPNEGAADATVVAADTYQEGHLTYIGTSTMDHYKLWKPFAGTMRATFESTTAGPSPAINVWTLNANVNQNITTGENGAIAEDTILIYTAAPDTILMRVSATDFNSCGSYRFRYESLPVGLDEDEVSQVNVSALPNPSSDGVFTLLAGGFQLATVEVFDARGALVHRQRASGERTVLDLAHLSSGLYSAHLVDATGHRAHVQLVRSE